MSAAGPLAASAGPPQRRGSPLGGMTRRDLGGGQ